MKLVFVSNYINHHQIPLSEELFKLTDGSYRFIQTEPMEEERIKLGWDEGAASKPYVIKYHDDPEECKKLIMEADCVIFGGTDDESYIMPRLEAGLFTIRYSERIYKTGRWKFITPRGLKKKYHDHTRFKSDPVYLLCAGAFVKGDFKLIHAYKGKMLKFGYFPETREYTDLHEERCNDTSLNILWVGRFIGWKHPEMMIKLNDALKGTGAACKITMVGTGPLLSVLKEIAGDEINFTGPKTPEEVRKLMREADIFISTSDQQEGWGAVINEAMNSGCTVVASDKIGAAPYLIKNNENGILFKSKSQRDLNKKVLSLIYTPGRRFELGTKAYETITHAWNAKVAAERLIKFIENPEHRIPEYESGPVSKA